MNQNNFLGNKREAETNSVREVNESITIINEIDGLDLSLQEEQTVFVEQNQRNQTRLIPSIVNVNFSTPPRRVNFSLQPPPQNQRVRSRFGVFRIDPSIAVNLFGVAKDFMDYSTGDESLNN